MCPNLTLKWLLGEKEKWLKSQNSAQLQPVCKQNLISTTFSIGILPRSWSHYTVPAGMTVIQWVSDFSERIKQLQNISQAAASGGAKELKVS